MTVNQRRKRSRGETYAGRKMVTLNLRDMYYAYSRPMTFVLNGRDETREIKCRVWE